MNGLNKVGAVLGGTIFDFFGVQGITPQRPKMTFEDRMRYINGIMGYTPSGKPMTTEQHEKWLIKYGFYGMKVAQCEAWAKKTGLGSIFGKASTSNKGTITKPRRSSMDKILARLRTN